MSSVVYKGAGNLIERVEHDGFFILKNFFSREAVEKARAELLKLIDADEARREAGRFPKVDMTGDYRSIYTKFMHTVWFPCLQSERYRTLLNDMFDAPVIRDLMYGLVGESLRIRIDLWRRSSGVNDRVADFQLPHVWHRDTPGEFTFGIFLDDLPEQGAGGTAVIPGSHWYKEDPRWDLMLGEKTNMTRKYHLGNRELVFLPDAYRDMAPNNRKLTEELNKRKVELCGQMGDIYFFLNDTYHGRAPNVTGQKWMIARTGCFGTEFPFKNDIPLPDGLENLPEPLRTHFRTDQAPNMKSNTLLRRMAFARKSDPLVEKAAAEKDSVLSEFYRQPQISPLLHDVLTAKDERTAKWID